MNKEEFAGTIKFVWVNSEGHKIKEKTIVSRLLKAKDLKK